jgi:murein DD-endopeptidase MepM/ murein hydrolase activator NlpD
VKWLVNLAAVGVLVNAGSASNARPADIAMGSQASGYQAPLGPRPTVLNPFAPPATLYGKGHLGVDLAAAQGVAVRSAGAGVVRFAGVVAGRGVVVVVHPDGLSTEYEPLAASVHAAQAVQAGQVIGRLSGVHRSCAPASCLHWGARRGDAYLDPLSLLRPLGVVRLLPWTDS